MNAELTFFLVLTGTSHFLLTATHAYLSLKHGHFEEKVYDVPIILNDNGKPPLENKVNLKGILCTELLSSRQQLSL